MLVRSTFAAKQANSNRRFSYKFTPLVTRLTRPRKCRLGKVTDRHTAIDYAHMLRDLSDVHSSPAGTAGTVSTLARVKLIRRWIVQRRGQDLKTSVIKL